jgi:4-hydroxy-2-oxoheptanedioate aldolase
MGQNKTKEKLAKAEAVYGVPMTINAPSLVELLAVAGMDFVMLDAEGGPLDPSEVENLARASELTGITPLVRVPVNRPEVIGIFLDRGAHGVVVPKVSSAEEAAAVVRAAKFPPEGNRGFAPARWTITYRGETDLYAAANRETLVICMVEDPVGMAAIGDIASVPGVDAVHIGPNDLALSLGHGANTWHEEVLDLVDKAVATVTALGNPFPVMGVGAIPPSQTDRYRTYHEQGVRYFQVALPGLINGATRRFFEAVRA